MYNRLFETGKIGNVTLKNHLVMSPMGCGLANMDGTPSEEMIAYYEERAIGGVGLIIPEITRVNDTTGAGLLRQLSVSKDKHIQPLSVLAERIHVHGAKIFIQLHHPGRETVSALLGGAPVVAPSAIPCKLVQQETRELSVEEIKQLMEQFVEGAKRVMLAGCDGVELHAAHGYLLQEFLSPYTNKRTDAYGGSFENRLRFLLEIIAGIKRECGSNFPVGVRLTVEEFLDKTGVKEDYIHLKDGILIAKALEEAGVDFLDVSCGLYETGMTCVEPISFPQGWRKEMLLRVKEAVNIPVIGVSVIRDPKVAEQFLQEHIVDFVSMGRSFIADPDWPRKAMQGQEAKIRKCISCLRCFESLNTNSGAGVPPICSLNPRFAKEKEYDKLSYDTKHHKVAVVGGGPAGMSAALTLAERGMEVTLIDRQTELGGTLNLAKKPPLKERMQWVGDYYENAFKAKNINTMLHTTATKELIEKINSDAVIFACGSTSIVPKAIPGVSLPHVFTVEEILSDQREIAGKKVVVIGAGLTGLETAEYLAAKQKEVTIVDMLSKPAPNANHTNVMDVCSRLNQFAVSFKMENRLHEITTDSVVIEHVKTKQKEELKADAVVLALGFHENQSLYKELQESLKERNIPLLLAGSAKKDGMIAEAVHSGYQIARTLFAEENTKSSFKLEDGQLKDFGRKSLMDEQEGLYFSYLTTQEAIARVLPPPLKPFSLPVVTVSICKIHQPSFADSYYEAILGIYATYKGQLGLYPIGLVLGGDGAEMAVQCGRDNGSIPKKLGAEFVIRKEKNHVSASVTRRGTQLVRVDMQLGTYNSPLTSALYQFPERNKQTFGGGFYFHFDRMPDEEGVSHFINGALLMNQCEYNYSSWEPATVDATLQSSIDDPWADLPIKTVIGGAYAKNSLLVHKLNLMERLDADEIIPYLLTARYDRTAFMETGRV